MRLLSFVFVVIAFWSSGFCVAQSYPSHLIRIIQPLGAGSPGDIVSRAIAQSLSQTMSQPVVVENRTGANGIIGMDGCAKAPADGYTLCVPSFSQVTMNPIIYANLPYDPLRDLTPVINIGVINSSIMINGSLPVNSLRELLDLAKTKPGAINWGSWGVGSFPHLYLTWMQNVAGVRFTHVPYRTIAATMAAAVSGEVQVTLNTPGLAAPLVKAGKAKVLAVIGRKRSPLLDAPTLEEAGFELPLTSWVGVQAPTGTPRPIVLRLNSEIGKLLADTKFVDRVLAPLSIDPIGGTPEEFGTFLVRDRDAAQKVAKLANLKAE